MPNVELQPSIAHDSRSRGFLGLVERLENAPDGAIDVTPILVSWIDYVREDVIPYLLWQWQLNSPMWSLVTLDLTSKRELIKLAASLHAKRGTPWAVRTALDRLGWTGTLLEGQDSWGGTKWPVEQGWAVCRLQVDLAIDTGGPISGVLPWSLSIQYVAGDAVTYPAGGPIFVATTAPPIGVPPRYWQIDDVPDMAIISNMSTLATTYWGAPSTINGVPYRPITSRSLALLEAAFHFFAPRRCWLEVVAVAPPIVDALLPALTDDIEVAPQDSLPTMRDTIALPGIVEEFIRRVPLADGSYTAGGGIDAQALPIGIADDGVGKF